MALAVGFGLLLVAAPLSEMVVVRPDQLRRLYRAWALSFARLGWSAEWTTIRAMVPTSTIRGYMCTICVPLKVAIFCFLSVSLASNAYWS